MHFVDADFELGLEFRDKIVPYALLWYCIFLLRLLFQTFEVNLSLIRSFFDSRFTGEAMGGEDDDDEDSIPVVCKASMKRVG